MCIYNIIYVCIWSSRLENHAVIFENLFKSVDVAASNYWSDGALSLDISDVVRASLADDRQLTSADRLWSV